MGKWDPYYVKSLTRFSDAGVIPALSAEQLRAAQILEDTCVRLSLHMILEIGDIQFLSNEHVLHARTAYKDHAPPLPRRHLMRLWLATPDTEGGWTLPFEDSSHRKRGGIQVNDNPPDNGKAIVFFPLKKGTEGKEYVVGVYGSECKKVGGEGIVTWGK